MRHKQQYRISAYALCMIIFTRTQSFQVRCTHITRSVCAKCAKTTNAQLREYTSCQMYAQAHRQRRVSQALSADADANTTSTNTHTHIHTRGREHAHAHQYKCSNIYSDIRPTVVVSHTLYACMHLAQMRRRRSPSTCACVRVCAKAKTAPSSHVVGGPPSAFEPGRRRWQATTHRRRRRRRHAMIS